MNADESDRCLEISKEKFKSGNSEAALKYARKAVTLNSTQSSQDWLDFVEKNSTKSSNPLPKKESAPKPPSPKQRRYTQDQIEGIKKIKAAKTKGDFYKILGLEKECTDVDIKKAYRKLALLYHPDKCTAPGTDDAFKAIGHAFSVLSDQDKRRKYDQYGIDSESSAASAPSGSGSSGMHAHYDFQNEVSPEDIFNMFFGAEFGPGIRMGGNNFVPAFQFGFDSNPLQQGIRERQRRQRQRQRDQNDGQDLPDVGNVCMKFLPIIILLIFSFINIIASFFGESTPSFSFQRTDRLNFNRHTLDRNIPYYVDPYEFKLQGDSLRKVERDIELEYIRMVQQACAREREMQRSMIMRAQGWFGPDKVMQLSQLRKDKLRQAHNFKMNYCDELSRLGIPR